MLCRAGCAYLYEPKISSDPPTCASIASVKSAHKLGRTLMGLSTGWPWKRSTSRGLERRGPGGGGGGQW